MRVKPIITGLLSLVPGAYEAFTKGPNPSTPAACYGVLFKHLCLMQRQGAPFVPQHIAEIGPGNSLGNGVLALLLGSESFVGLDVVPFALKRDEADVWVDSLVALLRQRAPLPNADGFPSLRPFLDASGFPCGVGEATLACSLDPARIAAVRACLRAVGPNRAGRADGLSLDYRVPWEQLSAGQLGPFDAVFSHTVMQHVPDPAAVYGKVKDMLRQGGVMSHQINHDSHGMSHHWNGHWAYPDWLWRIALGHKPFLINRLPYGAHLAMVERTGMQVLTAMTNHRSDGLPADSLAPRFRSLGVDASIAGSVLVAVRSTPA